MSIKSKIFAAAATLTMVGGIGAAGTLAANAATPSCGHNCIDIFSREFGTHKHPNFVLDVYQQKAEAGQPIILWQASNHDPAEDFTVSFQGTVNDFYKAGLVSAALNLHYSKFWAYEIQYSPNGVGERLLRRRRQHGRQRHPGGARAVRRSPPRPCGWWTPTTRSRASSFR